MLWNPRWPWMVGLLLWPSSVSPCSVEAVRSAEEVTDEATYIVRARADGYVKLPAAPSRLGLVEFTVIEVLKGSLDEPTLRVPGQLEKYDGPNDQRPPYRFVRPGGRHGDCYATDYSKGREYLLFLAGWRRGGITPYWAPLAATNEEVSGPGDVWVEWVRRAVKKPERRTSEREP